MGGLRIPLGEWAEAGVAWIRDTLGWLLSGVSAIVGWFVDTLANGLLSLPIVVVIRVPPSTAVRETTTGSAPDAICDVIRPPSS